MTTDHQLNRDMDDTTNCKKSNHEVALALSGGGKRAALFQCGGIMALAALCRLRQVGLISAISGGSLAALALKRAFSLNSSSAKPASDADIAWSTYDFLVNQVAVHDFRAEALLGLEHLSASFCTGEFRLTEAVAKQINAQLKGVDLNSAGPTTYIGVCEVATKALIEIQLTTVNAGATAAAAMALPGIFDAIPLANFGAVVDGGIADKTGLQLLNKLNWKNEVILLDASQASNANSQNRLGAMAALQIALEVDAESNRINLINSFGNRLKLASLRDGPIPGLDADCVDQLSSLRTDLDHFSPVETDSLIIAGFIATCLQFGDTPDNAHKRLTAFGAPNNGFARNVVRLSRGLRSNAGTVDDQPTKERLVELLKMGKGNIFKELSSSHPYLRLAGIFSFLAMPLLFFVAMVLLLTYPFWLGILLSRLLEWDYLTCIGSSFLIIGLFTAGWLRIYSAQAFGVKRWITLIAFGPLIFSLAGTWHYALQQVRNSTSVSSVVYPLGFLGRLWEIIDPRQYRKPFTFRTLLQLGSSVVLVLLLIINPLAYHPAFQSWLPNAATYPLFRTALTLPLMPVTVMAILFVEGTLVALSKLSIIWERVRPIRALLHK